LNRVAGSIDASAPHPPDMRVRVRGSWQSGSRSCFCPVLAPSFWPWRPVRQRCSRTGDLHPISSRPCLAHTKRCTEWRPRHAAWQFRRHGGAAIGELNR